MDVLHRGCPRGSQLFSLEFDMIVHDGRECACRLHSLGGKLRTGTSSAASSGSPAPRRKDLAILRDEALELHTLRLRTFQDCCCNENQAPMLTASRGPGGFEGAGHIAKPPCMKHVTDVTVTVLPASQQALPGAHVMEKP